MDAKAVTKHAAQLLQLCHRSNGELGSGTDEQLQDRIMSRLDALHQRPGGRWYKIPEVVKEGNVQTGKCPNIALKYSMN